MYLFTSIVIEVNSLFYCLSGKNKTIIICSFIWVPIIVDAMVCCYGVIPGAIYSSKHFTCLTF